MRKQVILLVAALILTPLGAQAADLVMWWDEGQPPGGRGGQGDHRRLRAEDRQAGRARPRYRLKRTGQARGGARGRRRPPDFVFDFVLSDYHPKWAHEGRLVDLTEAVGHFSNCLIRASSSGPCCSTRGPGQKRLYGLPMGSGTHHVHVWKSLLERAGFTLADIPEGVGRLLGILVRSGPAGGTQGAGATTSGASACPCRSTSSTLSNGFWQFIDAYEADYVTRDGRLVIDDPEVRRRLIKAIDSYTQIYRKGCTPPDSVNWVTYSDNNKAFLAQTIVMTPNQTLSIPNALKATRPDDYYNNAVTLDWPARRPTASRS